MREQLWRTALATGLVALGAALPVRADLTPPPQEWAAKFSRVAWQSMVTHPGTLPALGNAFTLEAWIFLDEYPSNNSGFVLSRPPDGGLDALYLTSSGQVGFTQGSHHMERGSLPLHRWVHVAGSLGTGTRRLYIDAVEVGSEPELAPSTGTGAFEIGPRTGAGIAQVRIWNRALSTAELAANAGQFLTGAEQGLLAYWPLDDGGRSETARDLGPFHATLTLGISTDFFEMDDRQPGWIPTADLANGPYFARKEIAQTLPGVLPVAIDYDGDGDLDLVSAGELQPVDAIDHPPWYVGEPPAPLTAFRNDGGGNFAEATDAVFAQRTQVTGGFKSFVDDFTGDGRADLYIPATGLEYFAQQTDPHGPLLGDRQTLLVGTVGGQLHSEPERFPDVNVFAHAVAVGDIDNDGDTDIFQAHQDDDCFNHPLSLALVCPSIWVNDGHGFFTDHRDRLPSAVPRGRSAAVALFDADGDGDADAWFGGECEGCPFTLAQGQLLLNDGTGHFAFAPAGAFPAGLVGPAEHIVTVDVDLDGDIDLLESVCSVVNCRTFRLLLNRGNGTFLDGSAGLPPPTPVGRIHAGDLNGDNLPEVTIHGNHPPTVLLNRGEGLFGFLPPILDIDGTTDYASGDFDGDGDRELVADEWWNGVQYFENLKPYRPVVHDCGSGVPCPALPGGVWLSSPQVDGFRFKVQIGPKAGRQESGCIAETLCVSGAVAGRPEVFLRVVGPKPNGFLWPTLVKFSTSEVSVWAEQTATGVRRYYRLAAVDPNAEVLDLAGVAHKEGFLPSSTLGEEARKEGRDWTYEDLHGGAETLALPIEAALRTGRVRAAETAPPPPGDWLTTPEIPGFRFQVRIGGAVAGAKVGDCIQETLCVSGAVPGRPEVFTRVVGPKPNGYLWPTLVKFSTSRIEVWVEKIAGGIVRHYDLPAVGQGDAFLALSGLADRKGFLP